MNATAADTEPEREQTSRATGVTVYSTGPKCVRCVLTIRRLSEHGVPFDVVDLSTEGADAARQYVTDDLGYSQAPVVVVGDHPEHHWSGFRPDLIDRLVEGPAGERSTDRVMNEGKLP